MDARGAIAAGHPETAHAAALMLEAGGNAFDATLAGVCAACVSEPILASLGGGGFLMARQAGADPVLYDFFPQTPRTRRPDSEVDFFPILADFGTAQQEFHIGMGSMATPGMVKGLFRAHRDLCSLPMELIIEPAVALARGGVTINLLQAYVFEIVEAIYMSNDACRKAYGSRLRPGRPVGVDEVLRMPDLATTLEALTREGEGLFYRGEIGRRLVEDCRNHGGLLASDDLETYAVALRRPLEIDFRDARIFTNPPPSSGGILIAFSLNLLSESDLRDHGFGSATHIETLAAVMRLTNKARLDHRLHETDAADAVEALLDPGLIETYRRQILGQPEATRGTTQISVIDSKGNAASMTVTNGEGAAYVIPDTGVMMNNMLGEEDINPHGFHRWPPDTRLRSMMAPSLVRHEDGAIEATGSGGSNRIRTAILQVLMNELEFGLSIEDAVTRPRLHVEGDLASVEAGFDDVVVSALARMFPKIERWDDINFFFGGAHSVRLDPKVGCFRGAGDPRRGGVWRVV